MSPFKLLAFITSMKALWIISLIGCNVTSVCAFQLRLTDVFRRIDYSVAGNKPQSNISTMKNYDSRSKDQLVNQSSILASTNPKINSLSNPNGDSKIKVTSLIKSVILPLLSIFAGIKLILRSAIPGKINTFFVEYPYIAAFIVCAFKASSADFLVQRTSLKRQEKDAKGDNVIFEWRRNIAFLFYGGAYQGCIQEYIFNHIYPFVFGTGTDPATVGKIVIVDIFVVNPMLNIPVAYIIKGIIYNDTILHSIKSYWHDVAKNGLLNKNWMSEYYMMLLLPFLVCALYLTFNFIKYCFPYITS